MPAKGQKITEEHRAAIRAAHAGKQLGQSPTKRCPHCKEVKPRDAFGLRAPNKYGKQYSKSYCKVCENLVSIEKGRGDPEKISATNRRAALSRYFDMTEDEFNELNDAQEGLCAICKEAPVNDSRLSIDHDHVSGIVRGLLCRGCNHGLGNFKDSPELLAKAIAYLAQEPASLASGKTFQATEKAILLTKKWMPNENSIAIAQKLKHHRGGRSKLAISEATEVPVNKIAELENEKNCRGDLESLLTLLNYYDDTLFVVVADPEMTFFDLHPELKAEAEEASESA